MKDSAFKLGASLALALSVAPAAHAGPVDEGGGAANHNVSEAQASEASSASEAKLDGPGDPSSGTPSSGTANEAQASFTHAIDLYTQGDYRAAAEAFLHTYALSGDAALLFNVAQCYRQLNDCDATRKAYTAYRSAALKDAAAEEEHGAANSPSSVPESWPAEFTATCGEEPVMAPLPEPPPAPAPDARLEPPLSAKPPSKLPSSDAKAVPDAPKPLSALAISGWITTGLGVAAGGIALYYGLRVEAKERASEALTGDAANRNTTEWKTLGGDAIDNEGVRSARLANVFTGAGAVLGAAGIYLLLSDLWSAPPKAPPLNVGISERGVFATWRQPL